MGPHKNRDMFQQEHLKADGNSTVGRPMKKIGTEYRRKWDFPRKYGTGGPIIASQGHTVSQEVNFLVFLTNGHFGD